MDMDVAKVIRRKQSVNEHNVVGLNFQAYEDKKPSKAKRLRISNFCDEYLDHLDKEVALQSFNELSELESPVIIGYQLLYSYS